MKLFIKNNRAVSTVISYVLLVMIVIAIIGTLFFNYSYLPKTPAIVFIKEDKLETNKLLLTHNAEKNLSWNDLKFISDAGEIAPLSGTVTVGEKIECPANRCSVSVVYIPSNTLIGIYNFNGAEINSSYISSNNSLWARVLGTDKDDQLTCLVKTNDGGYGLAGGVALSGAGFHANDILLTKITGDGEVLWSNTYGGNKRDELYSLLSTSDGGFLMGGLSYSFPDDIYNAILIKINALGELQWAKTYDYGTSEAIKSIEQTSDGGYILTGSLAGTRFMLIKIDSNGDVLWDKAFPERYFSSKIKVVQTTDDGYIVGGNTRGDTGSDQDFILIKTNSLGEILWSSYYGGSNRDIFTSLLQTEDDGFLIGGGTESFGEGSFDYLVIKTDSYGNVVWSKTYGGIDDDSMCCIKKTTDGKYLICGSSYSFGYGNDYLLIKIDSEGTVLWAKSYGGTSWEKLEDMCHTHNGGFLLGGISVFSPISSNFDFVLVCTDSNGEMSGCYLEEGASPIVNNLVINKKTKTLVEEAFSLTVSSVSPMLSQANINNVVVCPES